MARPPWPRPRLRPRRAATTTTPRRARQTEYLAAIKAGGNQGVHFDSVAKQNGTFHVTGDTGTTSGTQTLMVKNGRLTEHMTALWSGRPDT